MSGALGHSATLFALTGAALVGIGLYGFVARTHLLRRVLAFNVIGSGVFLFFGATGFRRPDLGADPAPQALIITGIIVALSLTALALALITRYAALSGRSSLEDEAPDDEAPDAGDERGGG
ncbi:MAG: hypothetical protein EA385_09410 [Salinarimonadaceae bacterium]|nr:MAG: hypothetical protein EA385_09410 [Salinarimonadaceae bacterium]